MKMRSTFNLSLFKKITLSLLFIIGAMQGAKAYTGACTPTNGTYQYYDNFGMITIVDPKGNRPGYLFPRAYNWNLGGIYDATCDCDPAGEGPYGVPEPNYYSTLTTLPKGHVDGENVFYKINDYLEVSTSIWISGNRNQYVPTPWNDESNLLMAKQHTCGSTATDRNFASGSKGILWLYITKPFVGTTYIENVSVISVYGTVTPGSYSSIAMSSVFVNGQVTVPQNCEINAGQIITVDFGKIWSGDFTTKGQKPDGYVAKNIKASMKCNNINAYTNLTIRFQSEISNDYPDAIKTNNPDIGVEIIDDNGHLVLPNTGLIPFNIDDKYEASVTFKAQPVSTTGNPPSAGQFQAQAYIRVDFA
ncbi:fimbrial protein [Hafnia alvei]|uniref:fimbrial protein n=1 Tax=Hafnia alvei TaxID=569 RepID=UPI001642DD98|nr:fimbrial protein [Hafnia alvei]MBI0277973.1 fimbrial protein [Hafnia alvei]